MSAYKSAGTIDCTELNSTGKRERMCVMAPLIEELRKEHADIVNDLERVRKVGISSKEGQEWLINAKKSLIAHIQKEDAKLYPVLKEAAEKDPAVKRTLELFAKDMAEISKTAIDFFEKYAQGGSGMVFAADYGVFFAALQSRIRREENIVYRYYEKVNP